MVEYDSPLDTVFGALSDPVRRSIIAQLAVSELTVSHIALEYDISLAAVSKHLKVLDEAKLITRRKAGKYSFVRLDSRGMSIAREYIDQFTNPAGLY